MAAPATPYRFSIELSDVDRDVYETLDLRVSRHPSEAPAFLLTRVLAYCLHLCEGLAFTSGLSNPDEPALLGRDLTGLTTLWIEVGSPSAERLHRAARASPRVVVFTYKDPEQLVRLVAGERIHRRESIELVGVPVPFLDALAQTLERKNAWVLVRQEDGLILSAGDQVFEGRLSHHPLLPS
jgi:uncharacterized protein YaeQ